MRTFKDLIVWQQSVVFATNVYNTTKLFPKDEIYGLTSQLHRASISVASNLAEGSKKASKKEFAHYIRISQGSGAEIETQLIIARNLNYISDFDANKLTGELEVIMKMLTALLKTNITE
jgi:four helix bundle protein